MGFKEKLSASRDRKNSNVILALDVVGRNPKQQLSKARSIVKDAAPEICAVKINRQLILSCGLESVSRHIVRLSHRIGLPTIMDAKINDVGHTNAFIANAYLSAGFDAVIASPFVGWEEGLEPVFRVARRRGGGVIVLVYMSHLGADVGYGRLVVDGGKKRRMFELFALSAKKWRADGAIVGATRPSVIHQVSQILGNEVPILAPGVGPQGGDIRRAIRAGADYLIVGRTILNASNPAAAARQISEKARQYS